MRDRQTDRGRQRERESVKNIMNKTQTESESKTGRQRQTEKEKVKHTMNKTQFLN